MGIICGSCGRDIDALGQDNMSCTSEPLCEDCWNEEQSNALDMRREVREMREDIECVYATSRERALALTKLDECELWLTRCKTKKAAAQAAADAAQDAAAACLKADEAHGVKLPDISVEVDAGRVAEAAAKSLREVMRPVMRMAVE